MSEDTRDWKEIASAAESRIGAEVLAWSGHEGFWAEYDLDARYDLLGDLLEWCSSVSIRTEEREDGTPGASRIGWCTALTDDPEQLRGEIQERIEALIERRA